MQTKIPLWQKLMLIVFGLFLALILVECCLRFARFAWELPSVFKNYSSMKAPGAYRILCIGESTTGGGQISYPAQLEYILNQADCGMKFAVINKGVGGADTTRIVDGLEYNLDTYKPNMVIAMMGINDNALHMRYLEEDPLVKKMPFFKHLRIYKLVKLFIQDFTYKSQGQENMAYMELKLKEAVRKNPGDALACYKLGSFYKKHGNFLKAEESLNSSLELNPRNLDVCWVLAMTYFEEGKHGKAEALLLRMLELDPRYYNAMLELARMYRDVIRAKQQEAEALYRKAIALQPHNYLAYQELAIFYFERVDYSRAEEYFKKVLSIEPCNVTAYDFLVSLYLKKLDYRKAEEIVKDAIHLDPTGDYWYGILASLYRRLGNPVLAVEYDKKANDIRAGHFSLKVRQNYAGIREALRKRNIQLVCVQYPMRNITTLTRLFKDKNDIVFIDNEKVFKDAVARGNYSDYFVDSFAGDFGHCTLKGNKLLAENIAKVILKEVFHKENLRRF